jgi:hypothetical protein
LFLNNRILKNTRLALLAKFPPASAAGSRDRGIVGRKHSLRAIVAVALSFPWNDEPNVKQRLLLGR